MKVLVIYASNDGHTAKIAAHLAAAIRGAGVDTEVFDAKQGATPGPAGYDGVVVVGSLHAGSHQRELSRWVKRHHAALWPLPSLFVSVSLSAAQDTDEEREDVEQCIAKFVKETGWTPGRSEPVAGALLYREYNFFTRHFMRWLMKRGGHPTDTSRDYDYTDWEAVTDLGHDFATSINVGNQVRR
jgi:menaquinone-dependent protoporphyrinogen oxidase